MKKRKIIFLAAITMALSINAQDWTGIPVPADAGTDKQWELQDTISDDFNYSFNAKDQKTNFGNGKWYNFFHNGWDGPGTTYWKYNHVSVDGSNLVVKATRWSDSTQSNPKYPYMPDLPEFKMSKPEGGINAGCITSNKKVKYPVFVEASVSVANIALASDVWLLSPDDTQEIDIIECYGGAAGFSKYIHLSHHSFIRTPFTDYQPKDHNSWWYKSGVNSWGDYCWNNNNRRYVRIGVNWIGPKHFEYYIDGDLVRVLYDKAFASKINDKWTYTYPTMKNGILESISGYHKIVTYASNKPTYSFQMLKDASSASMVSVIDPYNYQKGNGFTKEMDIIINLESQNWHVDAGRTPTDADLSDTLKNRMKVDWIRVYKPVSLANNSLIVQAENFIETSGTFNDAPIGGPGLGVKKSGKVISYVNKGDFVDYLVTIPSDGAYKITYTIASASNGSTIDFGIRNTIFNTTTVPFTGKEYEYTLLNASKTANFTAGEHIIRLTAGGRKWAWKLDKFTMTRVAAMKASQSSTSTEIAEINVFPNPATDKLNVSLASEVKENAKLIIFNSTGNSLISKQLSASTQQIELSELSAGMYILQVINGDEITNKKFIKR